jgi:hypothetical protein
MLRVLFVLQPRSLFSNQKTTMKNLSNFAILTSVLLFACTAFAFGQNCGAKKVAFPEGGNTMTLTGNTGRCSKFAFSVENGQKVNIKLTSTSGKALFNLQWDASEDETGTESIENQTNLVQTLKYPDWLISVFSRTGGATDFKMTITAVDE